MANYRSAEQEREFQAKVLFAAARLFLKKGYTFTSLKEIADEAGVNISSMKQFFGLKENILAELVKYVIEGQFRTAEDLLKGKTEDKILFYAAETTLQLYMAESCEHIRDVYNSAYSLPKTTEIIQQTITHKLEYNLGSVSGNSRVGGVTGYNGDNVTNSYNTGSVTGSDDYVGGVVGNNGGTITNCYYLDKVGNTTNPGGIKGADVADQAEAKTEDQFKSGEVAYLLQAGVAEVDGTVPQVWGQTIGEDDYPVLGGDKVYVVINCKGEAESYNNTADETRDHQRR